MNSEKVSIIVPVYNVEAYIRKCLDSLVAQDYENVDIIVVNDGSPANEKEIIDEYVKRYPQKLISIEKENGGYGSALEAAFQRSDADSVLICDPDDYLAPCAVSALVKRKQETGADVVVSAKTLVFCDNEEEKYDPSFNAEFGNLKDAALVSKTEKAFEAFYFLEPSPHGKLYPRQLVKDIRFPHKVSYTDNLLYFYVLTRIEKITYCAAPYAYYLVNREGNTRTDIKPQTIDAWVTVFQAIGEQTPLTEKMLWYRLFEGFFSIYYKVDCLGADEAVKIEKYETLLPLLRQYRSHREAILEKMAVYCTESTRVSAQKKALLAENGDERYRRMYHRRLHGSFKDKVKEFAKGNALLAKVYEKYHFHAKYFYTRNDPHMYVSPGVTVEKMGAGVTFFGYYVRPAIAYGHSLMHRVPTSSLSLKQEAEILVDGRKVSSTTAWNWQQGSMAMWVDEKHILHNFFDGKAYRSKKCHIDNGEETVYSRPVYSVAPRRNFALTLNFSRLAKLRPDYGYFNLPYRRLPDESEDGIFYGDLSTDSWHLYLSLSELKNFHPSTSMQGATHKVNHIDISPDEERAIFLHRWFASGKKYSRLLVVDIAQKRLRILADNDMVSHMAWVNNEEIFGYYTRQDGKDGYAFLNVLTGEERKVDDPLLVDDGHPTVYNERYIVVDTYPDYRCLSKLYLLDTLKKKVHCLAQFYSGKAFQGERRCDLHPRFDLRGKSLTLDSVCDQDERHVYHVDIHCLMEDDE